LNKETTYLTDKGYLSKNSSQCLDIGLTGEEVERGLQLLVD